MMLEQYIKLRNQEKSLKDIQTEFSLDEETVWTFELGYTCYMKKLPLEEAVLMISKWDNYDKEQMEIQIHDRFVDVFRREPTKKEIKMIAELIPRDIKEIAERWGWDDTEVDNHTYVWMRDHMEHSLFQKKET